MHFKIRSHFYGCKLCYKSIVGIDKYRPLLAAKISFPLYIYTQAITIQICFPYKPNISIKSFVVEPLSLYQRGGQLWSKVCDSEGGLSAASKGGGRGGEGAQGQYAPPGRRPSQKLPCPSLGLISGEGRTT